MGKGIDPRHSLGMLTLAVANMHREDTVIVVVDDPDGCAVSDDPLVTLDLRDTLATPPMPRPFVPPDNRHERRAGKHKKRKNEEDYFGAHGRTGKGGRRGS